jgi:hypothetical protein
MQGKRQFNIVDSEGNILYENVNIEDVSRYSTVGDDFGAEDVNATNNAVNELNTDLTASDNLKFQFTKSGNDYGYKDSNSNFHPFRKVQASKTVTAGTSVKTVTPDSGYHGIASVTVNPQVHSETRASVTANGTIDLGATHNIRYVPVNVIADLSKMSVGSSIGGSKGVTSITGLTSGGIYLLTISYNSGGSITLPTPSGCTIIGSTNQFNGEDGSGRCSSVRSYIVKATSSTISISVSSQSWCYQMITARLTI